MKYQRAIRDVLCLACVGAAICLTGCSISLCGMRPGGEELTFSCREDVETEGDVSDSGEERTRPFAESRDTVPESSVGTENVESTAETEKMETVPKQDEGQVEAAAASGSTGITADCKVDINAASMEELMTLSGVGETRAKAIIEYRTQNGPFTKAEDIMQIPGIKEGVYSKIQDQIIVR